MVVRRPLAVLCLVLTAACDAKTPTGPTVPVNERFTLGVGQMARVAGLDVAVRFLGVTGDSRCPVDAVCVQGGDAIVHIRTSQGPATAEHELHTGDSSRSVTFWRGVGLQLIDLRPYPFSSQTIPPGEYRATFVATRP